MRFGHVEVFVGDPSSARIWWERFGFEAYDVQAGGRIVWMRLGAQAILLRPRDGAPPGPRKRYGDGGPAIVLFTTDLDGAVSDLRARGIEPSGTDGEPRCPVFADADGNWIQLVDPRDHGVE
jgi:catechol 2,3-dioxygenase-like lactoylglutathione lyase family enzyme